MIPPPDVGVVSHESTPAKGDHQRAPRMGSVEVAEEEGEGEGGEAAGEVLLRAEMVWGMWLRVTLMSPRSRRRSTEATVALS